MFGKLLIAVSRCWRLLTRRVATTRSTCASASSNSRGKLLRREQGADSQAGVDEALFGPE